ncbi:hypothetical protein ACQPW3_15160 [Actinosynnema sp. CA-248983]
MGRAHRLRLGRRPAGYGIALACIGIGAAAGPLLLTRFVSDPRRPAFVFGPYLLRAAVDAVLAVVRTEWDEVDLEREYLSALRSFSGRHLRVPDDALGRLSPAL